MTGPCLARPQPRNPEAPPAKGDQGRLGHRAPCSPGWVHRDKPRQGALWPWQGR